MKYRIFISLFLGFLSSVFSYAQSISPELDKLIGLFFESIPEPFKKGEHFTLVEYNAGKSGASFYAQDTLRIGFWESDYHPYVYKDYKIVNGSKVYFYGSSNDYFLFDAMGREERHLPEQEPFVCIDPYDYVWEIVLFEDGTLNEFLTTTNIVHEGRDGVIDAICHILPRPDSLRVGQWLQDFVFEAEAHVFVDYQAEPVNGEGVICDICDQYHLDFEKGISGVMGILFIDDSGKAKFVDIKGKETIGEKNRRIMEEICKEIESTVNFIPAIHRGRKVKSSYYVRFAPYFWR